MNILPTFPVTELIDRYLIAEIKNEKGGNNNEELEFYAHQIKIYNLNLVADLMQQLKDIHLEIWNLEKELKTGAEQELPLEEIGRRAIAIRNKNNERVKCKNQIAELFGCKIKEFKLDHLSQ
jgi:hypothetical protein